MDAERHEDQQKRKDVQEVARAELRHSIANVKEHWKAGYQRANPHDHRLDTPTARFERQQEPGTGRKDRLSAELGMDIWEFGVLRGRYVEQREEIARKKSEGKQRLLIRRVVVGNPPVKDAVITDVVEQYVRDRRQRASRNEPEQLDDAAPSPEQQKRQVHRPDERKIVARQPGDPGKKSHHQRTAFVERLVERDQRRQDRDDHRHPPTAAIDRLVPNDRACAEKYREPLPCVERDAEMSEQPPRQRYVERAHDNREVILVSVHPPDSRERHQQDRRQDRMKLVTVRPALRMLDVSRPMDVSGVG